MNAFTGKAEKYGEGRLGYAPEAVAEILSRIRPGEAAADVGSGTGILSGEFIKRGIDVYCIEPDEAMRRKAFERFAENGRFRSLASCAENTGLPPESVALVTAASSFHWFNRTAFRRECLRILRPRGSVCIIINARSYDDALTAEQHGLCSEYCPKFKSLCHGQKKALRKKCSD